MKQIHNLLASLAAAGVTMQVSMSNPHGFVANRDGTEVGHEKSLAAMAAFLRGYLAGVQV